MKSLYESILGIDDDVLNKVSAETLKSLMTKYHIYTRGSGKNIVVTDSIYLKRNSMGEVVPFTSHMYNEHISPDDVPTLSTFFPDGATLTSVDHIYKEEVVHLSELPANIRVKRYYIDDKSVVDGLDVKVDEVLIWIATECLEPSILKRISGYTDTLYLPYVGSDTKHFGKLVSIKNCPLKNLVWPHGAKVFGLQTPQFRECTIYSYLNTDNLTLKGEFVIGAHNLSGQNSKFANKIKTWIKNNPKTNLIMSWGDKFEKLTVKNNEVVATEFDLSDL